MKTYTGLRNLYGKLTNDNSSENLALGDELMNDCYRRVCVERDYSFMQKTSTALTVALQQFYFLPYDYEKLISVTVAIGSQIYTPKEAPTRRYWDELNSVSSYSSNYPEWFFIFNGQLGLYPTPSTSGYTITYIYDRMVRDLVSADYTTGTVDAVTNGSTTVTGSGTTWTTPMAGRFIRINPTNVATSSGDGFWYEIASVSSPTSLTLVKAYQGTTLIAGAGATYTLGQVPVLPEPYQDLPVYYAAMTYFSSIKPDQTRYQLFQQEYVGKYKQFVADFSTKTMSVKVEEDRESIIINPNLMINA